MNGILQSIQPARSDDKLFLEYNYVHQYPATAVGATVGRGTAGQSPHLRTREAGGPQFWKLSCKACQVFLFAVEDERIAYTSPICCCMYVVCDV